MHGTRGSSPAKIELVACLHSKDQSIILTITPMLVQLLTALHTVVVVVSCMPVHRKDTTPPALVQMFTALHTVVVVASCMPVHRKDTTPPVLVQMFTALHTVVVVAGHPQSGRARREARVAHAVVLTAVVDLPERTETGGRTRITVAADGDQHSDGFSFNIPR